jgi:hypothetical protein
MHRANVVTGVHYALDATPMLHRLPAAWRLASVMPRAPAARFLVTHISSSLDQRRRLP